MGRKIRGGQDFLSKTVETTPPSSVAGDLVEFLDTSGQNIKDGGLSHASVAAAIAGTHVKDTDEYLDYGGANQVSAADLHTTVDNQVDLEAKKHTQNTDQYLDEGGANEITAAHAKDAYTHSGLTTNPHTTTAAQVGAIAVADGTLNALDEKTSVVDDDILLLEDSADTYKQKKVKKGNLVSGITGSGNNPYTLTSMYIPSLADGMYGAWKAGWEPFWFNQQWGGAPWVDNLVDGATGEAYTFQASSGNIHRLGEGTFGVVAAGIFYRYESFKVSKTGTQAALWLKLYKAGNPTDNITPALYADNAGTPDLTAPIANGATNTMAGTLITSNTNADWYRFVFTTPPSLTAGTVYHIVFDRSGAADATNYYVATCTSPKQYPHGNGGYGTDVPAWTPQTAIAHNFILEPVTNMLTSAGQFDDKHTFSEGSPLNQSEAMTQPLRNFFNYQEGTISIVGASWTKDKTILDFTYGMDHDRIVLRCNVTTGYLQLDVYDDQGTKYTITGATDVSSSTVRRITIAYRAKGDGSDFIYLYLDTTEQGTSLTSLTMTFDPMMKELGHAILGGGYALAPTWTKETLMGSLPAADGWTYDGTATEAAHAVVSGGKLLIQTVGSTDTCSWHIHPTLNNANGWCVEWKTRIVKALDTTGQAEGVVCIDDATKRIWVSMHTYYVEISYDNNSTYPQKVQIDLTKQEHIFHAEGKGSDFRLYCDGKLITDGTGLMVQASVTAAVYFGDITATASANAESIWDYIKYYETASLPPQFTAGSLSEFSYFSGDQTGLLTALYNSGTLKSVKELCGVGRNYIDVGKRTFIQKGDSAITTTATTATLMTDMERFNYGKNFEISLNSSTHASHVIVGIFTGGYCDGGTLSLNHINEPVAGYSTNYTTMGLTTGNSFGLHKLEGKWCVTANTGTTTYRRLIIKEVD